MLNHPQLFQILHILTLPILFQNQSNHLIVLIISIHLKNIYNTLKLVLQFLGLQPSTSHEYKFWHARRMAFIQCSLTGTALSWYNRLNDTYKQDWSAFVQDFQKQFSSQKNAYYAQVEALTLVKKDNETVRHFALKVQQLVEKSWCNEHASTINLNCEGNFTKGFPKNLKDFANKRQLKHTSTVQNLQYHFIHL